jgi:hypothetical protein
MHGQIEATNKSQSGKTLGVKVGETWYTSKNWELEGMVGQTIDFEPSSSVFNGKTMWWINDYGVSNAPPTADQAMAQAMANQPPPYQQGDRVNTAPQMPVAAPSPQVSSRDKDATIGALALTKAVSGDAATVWAAFEFFYAKLLTWQQGDADFNDEIPF